MISTIIATLQDRVVSWLYYADRIFQLPLGVIGVAVGVVLLPELSHKLRAAIMTPWWRARTARSNSRCC